MLGFHVRVFALLEFRVRLSVFRFHVHFSLALRVSV